MVSAGQLAAAELARAEAPIDSFHKWELFRALCQARLHFGVTDRDLTVLNALLSFWKGDQLTDDGAILVYPSNRVLGERAHGMAESTLRRHIAALVEAGLIARHDSPNGKRYAKSDGAGGHSVAFGFSLRPMLVRAEEIMDEATKAQQLVEQNRRQRETCVLILRDAGKLADYGMAETPAKGWKSLQERLLEAKKCLRRKMNPEALSTLLSTAKAILADVQSLLGMDVSSKTEKMSGSDVDTGRHYQNSNINTLESEPALEKSGAGGENGPEPEPDDPRLPLALVIKACPEIGHYAKGEISSWYDLIEAADFVRGMIGISPDAWLQAKQEMGAANAAIVLVAMLERVDAITSPGGYLRSLTAKAADGAFSPGPMVMALLNRGSGKAA